MVIFAKKWYLGEFELLNSGGTLPKSSALHKLCLVVRNRLLCLKSRVNEGTSSDYPILLPGKDAVVKLYARYLHRIRGHVGKSRVASILQERFHVLGMSRLLTNALNSCVVCKCLHGSDDGSPRSDDGSPSCC